MDAVVDSLTRNAVVHGSTAASEFLEEWKDVVTDKTPCEDFLGVAVLILATAASGGHSLEEKQDALLGLERCLALAAESLTPEDGAKLQRSILERTLRRFDAAADELAARATLLLLRPCHVTAHVTEPLRTAVSLLLRCSDASRLGVHELLDLVKGDVVLAVAVVSEALAAPTPPGLPCWSSWFMKMLHQITQPDIVVWLIQRIEPGLDFNSTPIADLQKRQDAHRVVVARSFVQFEVVDHALHGAEDAAQRHMVLASLLRAIHNLVSGHQLLEPGRLLSRCIALDFTRFGYRFLAPFVRKLMEGSHTVEVARVLRQTCHTLSWLLVHAESDGSNMLANAFKPLASEWALRSIRQEVPPESTAWLALLAANTGALQDGPLLAQLEAYFPALHYHLQQAAQRRCALTGLGAAFLQGLGIVIPVVDAADTSDDGLLARTGADAAEDDQWWSAWWASTEAMASTATPCAGCGDTSGVGRWGVGSFEGLWYCQSCWAQWDQTLAEQDIHRLLLSPWWPDASPAALPDSGCKAADNVDATSLLAQAPGHLRCGLGGQLLTADAVRVPGSAAAARPVAFSRRCLEHWLQRSSGRCPLSLEPLDIKSAESAMDVLGDVSAWLDAKTAVVS